MAEPAVVAFHPPFGTTKAAVLQPALRRRSAQQRRHPTRRPPSMRQMRAGRAGSAPPKVRRVRILSSLQQSCAARHARRRRRALPRSRRRLPGMTQQRALQLPAALLSSCERLFEALQCAFDGLEVESKEMGHWFECAVAGRAAEHGVVVCVLARCCAAERRLMVTGPSGLEGLGCMVACLFDWGRG